MGALSFASCTATHILTVPVRGGLPPSAAVRVSLISACCSLSSGLVSTISAYLLPSECVCSFKLKWVVGFRL
uniref:Uncharacterized protein n=1 Tax=Electrophorus electricus TaxID=8005 RepID=A0A4W4FAN7_ELEEL